MLTKPFTAMVFIDSARRFKKHIQLKLVGFPTSGNSLSISVYQLDALNKKYDGELDICAKRGPSEHRLIITQKVNVSSCDEVKSSIRQFAGSLNKHLGLTTLTQM